MNVYICNHHTDKYFDDRFFANLIDKCLYLQSSCMYGKVFQSPCKKLFANLAGECLYLQALYRKVVSITLQKSILITMQKRLTLTLILQRSKGAKQVGLGGQLTRAYHTTLFF